MHQQRLVVINSLINSSVRSGQLKEGLQIFQQALQEGLSPDKVTFLGVLSAFAGQTSLTEAKWMHTYIIASRHESDVMVSTSLIHMYGKYQCLDRARNMFEMMPEKNEVTWNAMITALAQNKQSKTVLLFFAHMESKGVLPTRITYIVIISVCANMLDLAQGMRMHARIVAAGFTADVVMESALVTFYGKCGSLSNAETVFNQIFEPNVVAWTAMISAYSEKGKSKEVFRLFFQMQEQNVVPNEVTFINLVDFCARQAALQMGMHLHALIVAFGFDVVIEVSNALIYFFGKCGKPEESWKIFTGMSDKDVISWNEMISVYACNVQGLDAIKLFSKMLESRVKTTKATFIGVFDACATLNMPSEAHEVHFCILHEGLESESTLINALISLYGSCDSLADARVMFGKFACTSNLVAWNALLGAYVQHGKGDIALALFRQMLLEGVVPNNVTYISAFSACACFKRLLKEGRQLHACCLAGTGDLSDVVVHNAILNMYSKCDSVCELQTIFLNMLEHNVISYNVLMSAYSERTQAKKVLQIFHEMLCVGMMPDEVSFISSLNACASVGSLTEAKRIHVCILAYLGNECNTLLWNALVYVYGKCNCIEGARKVFDELVEPDLVGWNALIAAFAESNLAFVLFNHMQEQGIMPDEVTFISIITACATQTGSALGSRVHACIIHDLQTSANIALSTALVKMHGSCGQVENAWITFKTMPERNLISWNAILTVYAHAGQGGRALELFDQMQQEYVTFDEITIVGTLSACSHEGLVDEAVNLFSCIECQYGLEPIEDHYSCMIDAFGRAGQLDEAELLLKSILLQASSVPEMTLLSACRNHGDSERGRRVLKWILQREPGAAAAQSKLTDLLDPLL